MKQPTQTKATYLAQFAKDRQGLRDSLVGLPESQMQAPILPGQESTVQRLALLAAHYQREAEALAYFTGDQNDPPIETDARWRQEVLDACAEWSGRRAVDELENVWGAYAKAISNLSDEQFKQYLASYGASLARPDLELREAIFRWRQKR